MWLGSAVAVAVLWLWHRPAATAPIRPLAWVPPHAAGAALDKAKTKTKTKTKKKKRLHGNLNIPKSRIEGIKYLSTKTHILINLKHLSL